MKRTCNIIGDVGYYCFCNSEIAVSYADLFFLYGIICNFKTQVEQKCTLVPQWCF